MSPRLLSTIDLLESIRVSLGGSPREDSSTWPEGLRSNEELLGTEPNARWYAVMLLDLDQDHLFENWDALGVNDGRKLAMLRQVKALHDSYPGGLPAYIKKARILLYDSASDVNPYDGYMASVPSGVRLEPGSADFLAKERIGLEMIAKVGFVLVAGGLGERLGYNGINLELPTESITSTSYLELYCKQILAIQNRYCEREMVSRYGAVSTLYLPLAIMTSDETHAKTEELLKSNDYFGLDSQQVTLLKQEKVATFVDNRARMALRDGEEGKYIIDAKSHGHGDIHSLMYSSNTAQKWQTELNTQWVVFLQGTNGVGLLSLPSMLGCSAALGLVVNCAAVPRVAKQAMGAIVHLKSEETGGELTTTVEYPQLEPLLTCAQNPEGDTNDPLTGYSKYPGNINQLVFSMQSYLDTLYRTSGLLSEFITPQYEGEGSGEFKSPAGLQCALQDYPKALESQPLLAAKVGYTQYPAWALCSPCKNDDTAGAADAAEEQGAAGSAWSAESGQYFAQAEMLRTLGVQCAEAPLETYRGTSACGGPMIVIKPSAAMFPSELRRVFPCPAKVTISRDSSLVVEGDVVIEELNLDGALDIAAAPGTKIVVRAYSVVNTGHKRRSTEGWGSLLSPRKQAFKEVDIMRGFVVERGEEEVVSTTGMDGALPAAVAPTQYSLNSVEEAKDAGGGSDDSDGSGTTAEDNTGGRITVYYYTGHGNLIHASMYDDAARKRGMCAHCAFRSCCRCCACCA